MLRQKHTTKVTKKTQTHHHTHKKLSNAKKVPHTTTSLFFSNDSSDNVIGVSTPRKGNFNPNYQHGNELNQYDNQSDRVAPGEGDRKRKYRKEVIPSKATAPIHPLANKATNPTYAKLVDMVHSGHGRELEQFLSVKENRDQIPFNSQDWFGSTLLCTAVKKHFYKVLLQLLPYCDPNVPSATGPPLFHAIAVLDLAVTRTLIEHGANVNYQDPNSGQTALMIAASLSNPAYLLYLIDKGAHINAQDKSGRTAFMYASKRGAMHLVQCLRDRGADITIVDNDGNDALFHAKSRQDGDWQKVEAIMKAAPISKGKMRTFTMSDKSTIVEKSSETGAAPATAPEWAERLASSPRIAEHLGNAVAHHAARFPELIPPDEQVALATTATAKVSASLQNIASHFQQDFRHKFNSMQIKTIINEALRASFTELFPTRSNMLENEEFKTFMKNTSTTAYNNMFPLTNLDGKRDITQAF